LKERLPTLFWAHREDVKTHLKGAPSLIYSSTDVRDSGGRVAAVDVNVFPGGFNNLQSLSDASTLFERYVGDRYGDVESVGVVPEGHTRNPYYFDNLCSIRDVLEGAGYETSFVTEDERLLNNESFEGSEGGTVRYDSLEESDADLYLLNNDLTDGSIEALKAKEAPVEPPQAAGWWSRSKGEFFSILEEECAHLADIVGVEEWRLFPKTRLVEDVDFEGDLEELAVIVDQVLGVAGRRSEEPVVFIKDDRGTYGQGMTTARSGNEVREMSNGDRKEMAVRKGGHDVDSVVVQEGVPTRFSIDDAAAEPVQYVVGGESAGYFWRSRESGSVSVLNSPGQSFHPPGSKLDRETVFMHETMARIGDAAAARQIEALASDLVGVEE